MSHCYTVCKMWIPNLNLYSNFKLLDTEQRLHVDPSELASWFSITAALYFVYAYHSAQPTPSCNFLFPYQSNKTLLRVQIDSVLISTPQASSQWTARASPSPPTRAVRSLTWMETCIWEVYPKIGKPSFCPLRCGQPPSASASWAAWGTCSSMDRAATCGGWPRCRVLRVSAVSAPGRLIWGAPETRAPMADTAERAGIGIFATVAAQATWAPAVRRVRVPGRDDGGGAWRGQVILKCCRNAFSTLWVVFYLLGEV